MDIITTVFPPVHYKFLPNGLFCQTNCMPRLSKKILCSHSSRQGIKTRRTASDGSTSNEGTLAAQTTLTTWPWVAWLREGLFSMRMGWVRVRQNRQFKQMSGNLMTFLGFFMINWTIKLECLQSFLEWIELFKLLL